MIIDQERLVDGFRGMLGMDGSRDPSQIADRAAAYAVNCTFRGGGGPQTRPGFREVPPSYWQTADGSASNWTLIANALYVQGAFVYKPDVDQGQTQILVACDGAVFRIQLRDRTIIRLTPASGELAPLVANQKVYFCQAEHFVILQDGVSGPWVYDGSSLRAASSYSRPTVPVGKQMAYGQGRLFVAVNDGREIVAGDLVYGGSTTAIDIGTSTAEFPTVFTTLTDHGFTVGDSVTIFGHSSVPPINGSYVVSDVPSPSTFSVPAAAAGEGYGGVVGRFNVGSRSDLLRFTETTFLAEGGAFSIPSSMGRVKTLTFVPLQDTATGQGDLIALCERGAASFQVSAPRDQWKQTTGFQRVLFLDIGSVAESTQVVNGDLFFRSADGNGIRTYRNARAEFDGYGQTPMSSEIDPILALDTLWLLNGVSFAYFDDRLLMTCWPVAKPKQASNSTDATSLVTRATPVVYTGMSVLDFRSTASNAGKSAASFDGVWTGLNIVSLLQGDFEGDERLFALCFDPASTNSGGVYALWEITKDAEFDSSSADSDKRIQASVIPRAFQFEETMTLKKLIRSDVWFDDVGGGPTKDFESTIYFKADNYPIWCKWFDINRCFTTTNSTLGAGQVPNTYNRGYVPQVKSPAPPTSAAVAGAVNVATSTAGQFGYEFLLKIEWKGRAKLSRVLVHALKLTESVGGAK
jgi:hypothetical protein